MSKKVVMCSVIASLGGILFGFDTVVISGAEQTIQKLWGLGAALHGLTLSAALWGTVLGALLATPETRPSFSRGGCVCRSCWPFWWRFSTSFPVSTRFCTSRRAFSR